MYPVPGPYPPGPLDFRLIDNAPTPPPLPGPRPRMDTSTCDTLTFHLEHNKFPIT